MATETNILRYVQIVGIYAGLFALLLTGGCQAVPNNGLQAALDDYNAGKGMSSLIAVAKKGNREAQAFVGAMYGSGQGVQLDYERALYWQRKAAEQGHVKAQYNVAVLYSRGLGTKQDLVEAAAWFGRAAEQGLPEARMHLGLFHEKGWVLRKCPYAASGQYYLAGRDYLKRGNIGGAKKALAEMQRVLPGYYMAAELEAEIYVHDK